MILKLKSSPVDLNGTGNTVNSASVVSIINTNASFTLITIASSGYAVHVAAGERVVVEKDPTEELISSETTGVHATAIAYSIS
jgi:hypothetical protein